MSTERVADFIRERLLEAFQRRTIGPRTGPIDGSEWAPQGIRQEPLTRPRLCKVTGYHDPRQDGTCRDCGALVTDQDQCCANAVLYPVQPDEATR